MEKKLFIGFGFIAMLAGIYIAFADNFFIGIMGAITGAFIIYLNVKASS